MKKYLLFITLIICGCKSEVQNDFDVIIHYSITDDKVSQYENNSSLNKSYSGLGSSKSIEKKLLWEVKKEAVFLKFETYYPTREYSCEVLGEE
jgi:hypothetical protein